MSGPRYAQPPDGRLIDPQVSRQFVNIKCVLDHIGGRSDYGHISLTDLDLEVGYVNKVAHGLGVTPSGWRVTAQSAAAIIYEDESSSDTTYLYLLTSGDVTVDLEVW